MYLANHKSSISNQSEIMDYSISYIFRKNKIILHYISTSISSRIRS